MAWTLGGYILPVARGGDLSVRNRAVQGCGIARLPDNRYLAEPHPNLPGCDHRDDRWRGRHRRSGRGGDPARPVIAPWLLPRLRELATA